MNGNPRFVRNSWKNQERKEKLLFGPLSPTHPAREIVIERFNRVDPLWDLVLGRLSPKEYDQRTRKYSMIAAVRGNGVDTHRLWETLYRGATPIVVMDIWWESLRELFPQVVTISDWNLVEISGVVQSVNPVTFDPTRISALWMPFWEQKIRSYLDN